MPKPAPEKKVQWKLWLRVGVWCVAAAGTSVAAREVRQFAFTDPRFSLHEAILKDPSGNGILIQGARYTPHQRVMQVFAPDFGRSVFRTPIAERRRRLLAIDWVEEATVARIWPNRLIVRLRERNPVAFASIGTGFLLVDAQGVLLTMPPKTRFALPVITGLTTEEPESERRAHVQAALQMLSAVGPVATNDISEVHAEDLSNLRATVQMQDGAVEIWMGDQNYASRYESFVNHYGDIRRNSARPSVFDLRIDGRIFTR
jgi:cell division protein FtsQ